MTHESATVLATITIYLLLAGFVAYLYTTDHPEGLRRHSVTHKLVATFAAPLTLVVMVFVVFVYDPYKARQLMHRP